MESSQVSAENAPEMHGKKTQQSQSSEIERKSIASKSKDALVAVKSAGTANTTLTAASANENKETNAPAANANANANVANSKEAEEQRLRHRMDALQKKAKTIRAKLGMRARDLQQQTAVVAESEELRRRNDRVAAQTMKAVSVRAEQKAVTPVSSNHSTGGAGGSKQSTNNSSAVSDSNKANNSTHSHKTRRELQEQVEGLQELLSQLSLENPKLKDRIQTLVQRNPKLKQVELFVATTSTSKATGKLRQDSERSVTKFARQRHESEISNSSTSTSQKDYTTTTTNENGTTTKQGRKRGARKKKNQIKPAKSQASELEALTKYINTIVADYLGSDQKELKEELEFKGTLDDLEAHAQRLVQAGLGRIVEEEIRINRKNNRQSFITMSADREALERDGIILLPVARRYAFEGDTVRAFVMNAGTASTSTNNGNNAVTTEQKKKTSESVLAGGKDTSFSLADDENPFPDDEEGESPDSDIDPNELDVSTVAVPDNCPKSFVISIVKQTELRQVVGTISFKNPTKLNGEQTYYKLKPHDMRVPMVYIPAEACLAHINGENKSDICGLLYLAQVIETDVNGHCIGELVQPVGKVGDLEAEIKAILLHNGLKDIRPYEQRFSDLFAQPDPPLTEADLRQREDLRKKCIFTIDPMTARDLDDAVSLEPVGKEEYEVGVHISDVSHYLEEDSELDQIVQTRATSIYLVNEVIHMLPQTLCFKCSLLPGEDKFAFSVFWRMNTKGDVLGEPRFARTLINSCAQLAYEHAQKVIEHPKEDFGVDDFPTICNGFTVADICMRIKMLNKIAENMRKKRFDDGALSINNPKLRFNLDPKTGEPVCYEVDGRQEANFLIEEYMLLANQSVARFIYDHFPDISILRHHAPPLSKSMKNLREKLAALNIEFDASSSKSVYASMQRICREAKDPKAMDACLSTLLTKPMARAKYFCSEGHTDEADLWHYALSIPIYTHFTSPIRRYPDILVHRVLAAALNYCPPPKRSPDELHVLAKVCNDQKYNAKNAGDESINLFFKRYIKAQQSVTLRAVITEIFQHSVNVVTIETGHAISINFKMQKVLVDTSNVPSFILISEKNSKNPPLKLQMFSTVDVKLVVWDEKICGFFVSPDPKQRQLNSIELSKKKQQQQQQQQQQNYNNTDNEGRRQRGISERNANTTQQQD